MQEGGIRCQNYSPDIAFHHGTWLSPALLHWRWDPASFLATRSEIRDFLPAPGSVKALATAIST